MTGLSDVWSAIRNTSAAQLGLLIDALSLEHGQSLALACAQVFVIPKLLYFPRMTISLDCTGMHGLQCNLAGQGGCAPRCVHDLELFSIVQHAHSHPTGMLVVVRQFQWVARGAKSDTVASVRFTRSDSIDTQTGNFNVVVC